MTRPLPSHVIHRELDRAKATGILRDYRFMLGRAGNRRWILTYPDGTRRDCGSDAVAAFIDGIALAMTTGEDAS